MSFNSRSSLGDSPPVAATPGLAVASVSLRTLLTTNLHRRGPYADMPSLVRMEPFPVRQQPLRRSSRLARNATMPREAPTVSSLAAAALASSSSAAASAPQPARAPGRAQPKKRTRAAAAPATRSSKRVKSLKKPPPKSPPKEKTQDDLDSKPSADAHTCTICMCEPDRTEVSSIDGCDHLYCFSCIGQWSERENSCPLCKTRFTKISRVHPQKKKKGETKPVKNTKRVKTRDQRTDVVPGAALEGLLASIASGGPLGRYIVATQLGGAGARLRAARMEVAARQGIAPRFTAQTMMAPPLFTYDDDDDDDDESFVGIIPDFMNALLRSHHQPLVPPFLRTHAVNANDFMAGRVASNPLEISSDSDDEDEVELVHVTRSM